MKRIICDTNIWYGLGNSSITKPKNVKLIATWINIIEIGFSHEEIKENLNVEDCKKAAKAILDFADEIIYLDPFGYATNRISSDFKINQKSLKDILIEISTNGLPDTNGYLKNKSIYDYFMTLKNNYSTNINLEKDKIRKVQLKDSTTKDAFKISDNSQVEEHAVGLLTDINEFLQSEHDKELSFLDKKDFDFTIEEIKNDFVCFLDTKQKFMKKLVLIKSMKMQPNDFFDLLNLLYIDKDTLFWTKEIRWKSALKEADMENFLYEK